MVFIPTGGVGKVGEDGTEAVRAVARGRAVEGRTNFMHIRSLKTIVV